MEILLFALMYVIEIIKYSVTYDICFQQRLKLKVPFIVGGIITAVLLPISMIIGLKGIFVRAAVYFVVLMVICSSIRGKFAEQMKHLLVVYFVVTSLDSVVRACIGWLWGVLGWDNRILSQCLEQSLLVVCIIVFWKNQKNYFSEEINRRIRSAMQSVAILMTMEIYLLLYLVRGLEYFSNKEKMLTLIDGLCDFAFLAVLLMMLLSIYVEKVNNKLEFLWKEQQQLLKMQELYYTKMMERETETRRYRHDMTNHLICLNDLMRNEEYPAVKEYLSRLQGDLKKTTVQVISSGNDVIDTLTTYYLGNIEGLKLRIRGQLLGDLWIEKAQLCTIYGNLIANAAEAVISCEREQRYITIECSKGTNYWSIRLTNSYNSEVKIDDQGDIVSKKEETHLHGFGLKNVKRAVEHLNGELFVEYLEDRFSAEIRMKKPK